MATEDKVIYLRDKYNVHFLKVIVKILKKPPAFLLFSLAVLAQGRMHKIFHALCSKLHVLNKVPTKADKQSTEHLTTPKLSEFWIEYPLLME